MSNLLNGKQNEFVWMQGTGINCQASAIKYEKQILFSFILFNFRFKVSNLLKRFS
jgi:hypothetical protein